MKGLKIRFVIMLLTICASVAGCATTCKIAGYHPRMEKPGQPNLTIECAVAVVEGDNGRCVLFALDEQNMEDLMLYLQKLEQGYE